MAIALISAGGVGTRTGNKVPKQFLTIGDVPIIVYTMKNVEDSQCFNELYVICSDGWKDFVNSYALQYNISIFKGTITGGITRFDSCYNGLSELIRFHDPSEVVSILDGNRPLTSKQIFLDSMLEINNADCVLPLEQCNDSMYIAEKDFDHKVISSIDRSTLFKGQSPETSRLGIAFNLYSDSMKEKCDLTLTALMLKNGKKVSYINGSALNFKITTAEDIELFKSLKKNMF